VLFDDTSKTQLLLINGLGAVMDYLFLLSELMYLFVACHMVKVDASGVSSLSRCCRPVLGVISP
jgi:hypothetical protein